eukprot:g4151.t1
MDVQLGVRIFGNGRLETFIDSRRFGVDDMCHPAAVPKIAKKMSDFHNLRPDITSPRPGILHCINDYFAKAEQIRFDDVAKQKKFEEKFDFQQIKRAIQEAENQCASMTCPIVLCHNDLVPENILLLKQPGRSHTLEGSEITFIDFECSSYSYRGIDLSGYFIEHQELNKGNEMNPSLYPTETQRRKFLEHYLHYSAGRDNVADNPTIDQLLKEVDFFTPFPHGITFRKLIYKSNSMRKAVVLDNGGYTLKAGFAGDEEPIVICPNLTFKSKGEGGRYQTGDVLNTTSEILSLTLRRPIDKGYLVNMELQREIWSRVFKTHLKIDPKDCDLILTEPLMNLDSIRTELEKTVFDHFGFRSLLLITSSELAILLQFSEKRDSLSNRAKTGIVIDVGFSFCHVVPICNGTIFATGVKRIDFGGKAMTNYLKELVSFRSLHLMEETYLVETIKEDLCFVSQDIKSDLKLSQQKGWKSPFFREFVLPDGVTNLRGYTRVTPQESDETESVREQVLAVNNERFMVPEVLFNPMDIGLNQAGLPEVICQSIQQTPSFFWPLLYSNIILIGGVAQCPGFADRLRTELRKQVDQFLDVVILEPTNPVTEAWKGGSLLGNSSHGKQMLVSRQHLWTSSRVGVYSSYCNNRLLRSSRVSRKVRRVIRDTHVAPLASTATSTASAMEKEFQLPTGEYIKVLVNVSESEQDIHLETNYESPQLILHWGLVGGKGYKGGWRLPDKPSRPEGTVQYKNRALQTMFQRSNGNVAVDIHLKGDEVSDVLNFVLKDNVSGRWSDDNGSNFSMLLKPPTEKLTFIPDIPQKLCDIWAYLKWEISGCPNRSMEDANAEYQVGIQEIKALLQEGLSLDEIWRVGRGEIDFKEFRNTHALDRKVKASIPAPVAPPPSPPIKERKQRRKKTVEPPPAPPVEDKTSPSTTADIQLGESRGLKELDALKLIKPVEQEGVPLLSVEKTKSVEKPMDFIVQKAALDPSTKWRRLYNLGSQMEVFVSVQQPHEQAPFLVTITTDAAFPFVLHWGVARAGEGRDWQAPAPELYPSYLTSTTDDKRAAETILGDCNDEECDVELIGAKVPLQRTKLEIPWDAGVSNVLFVLRSADRSCWYKDGHGNFVIPLPGAKGVDRGPAGPDLKDEFTRGIVDLEVGKSGWTLMHRFHAAADMIEGLLEGRYTNISLSDGFARIYIWLRYSATRQITWQRNYNTKPRDLAHAQDRLTNCIANAQKRTVGEAQEWVRLMLSTVGRGGDGQRIRDEILHIMHRNKVKEVRGEWLEAWHQKLHNNTTPDDVPICEAYIKFMESNGDADVYWRHLSDSGITKERVEGYDRPVVGDPQFYPDKKEGLVRDMYNYLGILKNVHSGADFQASVQAVQNQLPGNARTFIGYVQAHMNDPQILSYLEAAVEARMEIKDHISGNRDLIYLDLALEEQIRKAAERGAGIAGLSAASLITPLLQNLCLSAGHNEEICFCLMSWQGLPESVKRGYPNQEDALKGGAVLDRLRRALAEMSDRTYQRIGEPSAAMGTAFGCEEWAVNIFAEEVIRGGPAFALSSWQIISPVTAIGRVVSVPDLHEVQDTVYKEPTIILAERVSGEEEIPEGVVGLLTPDAPDILSHVSVRARNMNVLFAACRDRWRLDEIKKRQSKVFRINPAASGEVRWEEVSEKDMQLDMEPSSNGVTRTYLKMDIPQWIGKYVVSMDEFADGVVGAKSRNIAGLRKQIPDWIQLPSSITVPFGTFEHVLEQSENKYIKDEIENELKDVESRPAVVLERCRKLVMEIRVPQELQNELRESMRNSGIPIPESQERWMQGIEAMKGVWASKFNDRAFYSMRKVGLKIENLRMAVLVQRVVPAEYAFVIHTKNPSNGKEDEIYCELVKGLGESLVSGMVPGSSMAFVGNKANLDNPKVLLYPSKSNGMFVRESLIFRSDSNGEDLEGYAGAGLYESITMDTTELRKVDYVGDRLIKDSRFRTDLLSRICKVGAAIENALGSAQDVEGVVSSDGTITVVQTRPQV